MFARDFLHLLLAGLLAVLGVVSGPAAADMDRQSKVVGGMTIYVGIVPAEIVRGYPKEHVEGSMHGGAPSGSGQYHLVVALFDSKTGERVSDAEVRARVEELGLGGEEKRLEPMLIDNTVTYGNFFRMPNTGPYRIVVQVRRPGSSRVEAVFEHRHR
ncbi:MAG TPA: hypothetical protein VHE58_10945 [Burkholderiales bacterium]|nr:hypothetical protein [Burkholderiales bacterium]